MKQKRPRTSSVSTEESATTEKKPAAKKSATRVAMAGAGRFFVLIDAPSGEPPMMRIRDFRPTAASACGAPVRVVAAFPFVETGQRCPDGPVCQPSSTSARG